MTLKVNINLLQDNNGVPGEPIPQDQIKVNDSFFVEIEVADIRDNATGVIGLALDVQWDAAVLEALDAQVTDNLPLNPQGTIDNDNGLIDDLGAGALPNFNLGSPIGINELERFALLHFKGELVTENPIPLTVTVPDPRSISFADGLAFDGETDIEAQTLEITPDNTPPTLANALADVTATEDSEFSFTIPDNTFQDIDPGDSLTYSARLEDGSELPSWLTFDAATGTFNGTPTNSEVGTLTIKVTASDDAGEAVSDSFDLTVENLNDAPTLVNEIPDVTATEDSEFSFTIPENTFQDVDPGDNLTYSATLEDGSELPSWLTFDAATGTFNGTPTNSEVGTLNIKVTATDDAGEAVSDSFDLTVENVNDSPTLVNEIPDVTATEDSEFSFTIPDNTFADVDPGDSLTYSARLEDGSELPSWLSFDAASRTFSGTPVNSDVGTLNIKVTATDNAGESKSDSLVLTVENVDDAPTIKNEIADVTVNEDADNSVIDLSDTFTDIDNDDSAIVKGIPANSNSALVTASIDGDTLILNYQDNQSGTAQVTVRGKSNGKTVEDTFTVTVAPVDDAPIVQNAIADMTVEENADNSVIDLSDTFSDLDNDDSAIIKTISTNSNEDLVTATLDGNNLILDYQNNQSGTAEITIQGESNGQFVTDIFNITVNEAIAFEEYLVGGEESDELNGSSGNDSIFGGMGDDSIVGGKGHDFLLGLADNDLVEGEEGDDYLVGYHGDDSILGGEGDDILLGNQGNDTLDGGTGNDILSGGAGDDVLSGGAGNDTLWGKEGADIFVIELGQSQDLISDFTDGVDLIGLSDGVVFDDLTIVGDDNAQIIDGNGNTLALLSGVNANVISTDDFQ